MKTISIAREVGTINLPPMIGEHSLIPFDLATLEGLPKEYIDIVSKMITSIKNKVGTAFFTIHGAILKAGQTHRRPGKHTDGSYDKAVFDWSSGGWKVNQDGPDISSDDHARLYTSNKGGIILASNHTACIGYLGEYEDNIGKGGNCEHINLSESFKLKPNTIYYGNNHFIHESIPMDQDVHRVLARITLPSTHEFEMN